MTECKHENTLRIRPAQGSATPHAVEWCKDCGALHTWDPTRPCGPGVRAKDAPWGWEHPLVDTLAEIEAAQMQEEFKARTHFDPEQAHTALAEARALLATEPSKVEHAESRHSTPAALARVSRALKNHFTECGTELLTSDLALIDELLRIARD